MLVCVELLKRGGIRKFWHWGIPRAIWGISHGLSRLWLLKIRCCHIREVRKCGDLTSVLSHTRNKLLCGISHHAVWKIGLTEVRRSVGAFSLHAVGTFAAPMHRAMSPDGAAARPSFLADVVEAPVGVLAIGRPVATDTMGAGEGLALMRGEHYQANLCCCCVTGSA